VFSVKSGCCISLACRILLLVSFETELLVLQVITSAASEPSVVRTRKSCNKQSSSNCFWPSAAQSPLVSGLNSTHYKAWPVSSEQLPQRNLLDVQFGLHVKQQYHWDCLKRVVAACSVQFRHIQTVLRPPCQHGVLGLPQSPSKR
jgi:hypothetical protein